MKKVLAIAGSNSSTSINRALLKYTLTHFEDTETKLVDMSVYDKMPIYSIDQEKRDEFPKKAQEFIDSIASADLLIISLAEHNNTYTAAFKNLIDWSSRLNNKLFQEKPILLMSTSPGKRGGANVMSAAASFFPFIGADIIGKFSLPKFNENFDPEKGITDAELNKEFLENIKSLKSRLHQNLVKNQ